MGPATTIVGALSSRLPGRSSSRTAWRSLCGKADHTATSAGNLVTDGRPGPVGIALGSLACRPERCRRRPARRWCDGPRHVPRRIPAADRSPEPLPAGRAAVRAALPDPRAALQRARGRARGAAADPAVHGEGGSPDLGDGPDRSARRPGRAGLARDPPRHGGAERDGLHPAAADGRLLRVLDDARPRRRRPEAARRALLPVHHRRGRLHRPPLHPRRRRSWDGSSSTSGRSRRARA